MAIGIHTALHHFKAPTTIVCGHASSIWSTMNGVPSRGTLGEIPLHGTQSLTRSNGRRTALQDGAMVRARERFSRTCYARLMLRTGCASCLRTLTPKIMIIDGGRVPRGIVCRWSLRGRAEGFCDTVLRVGSSARKEGAGFEASLLVKCLSSGCMAGMG